VLHILDGVRWFPGARLPAILAVAGLAVLLAGCGASPEKPQESRETDANGVPVVHIPARYATGLAQDVETLAGLFETAFVGEVTGEGAQREERAPGSRNRLPVSVYTVRVISSASDVPAGTIVEVEQLGGLIESDTGAVRVLSEGDSPIESGARYLFIVSKYDSGAYRGSPLSRFPVLDGRIVAPQGWEELGASQELAGLSPQAALERAAAHVR
jgi:hypothetical protein